MSLIEPMTNKSKPFLLQVTNQSNMNKGPGVVQSTYCMNSPYASHQLISPGLMIVMLTSLVSKYFKRLQPTFSRLLVMGLCWSWGVSPYIEDKADADDDSAGRTHLG